VVARSRRQRRCCRSAVPWRAPDTIAYIRLAGYASCINIVRPWAWGAGGGRNCVLLVSSFFSCAWLIYQLQLMCVSMLPRACITWIHKLSVTRMHQLICIDAHAACGMHCQSAQKPVVAYCTVYLSGLQQLPQAVLLLVHSY
jgi:hypothetical protein